MVVGYHTNFIIYLRKYQIFYPKTLVKYAKASEQKWIICLVSDELKKPAEPLVRSKALRPANWSLNFDGVLLNSALITNKARIFTVPTEYKHYLNSAQ